MSEPPTDQGDEWHSMNPSIEEARELPVDHSRKGPGRFTIEVSFNRQEIDRIYDGLPRGPLGITRFIKEAALAEADRRATEIDAHELQEAD